MQIAFLSREQAVSCKYENKLGDKTIIHLGYPQISSFVSVWEINYLP